MLSESLLSPFRSETGNSKLLIAIFLAMNLIVGLNALLHDPAVGYDASEHILYIRAMAEFRLPTPEDSFEYFSAPLPYVPPALLYSTGWVSLRGAAKFAQILNGIYSIGLTFFLLKLCDLIRPRDPAFKIATLGLLGSLPVYYKTFAFVRGEPLLAFLSIFTIYQSFVLFFQQDLRFRQILLCGLSLGLLVLARQWGFFLFPLFALCAALQILRVPARRAAFCRAFFGGLAVCAIVAGWFYLYLYLRYGTMTAFPRLPATKFSFSNQPREFYFSLGLDKLFSDPVRKAFPNLLIPKFYSEFWGDYECYFSVYGWDIQKGEFEQGLWLEERLRQSPPPAVFKTNRYSIQAYLGRVNLVSLFPTIVLIAGVFLGGIYVVRSMARRLAEERELLIALLEITVLISLAGYFWFLIMYPNPGKGDTIKASYLLQVFPIVALMAGEFLLGLYSKFPRACRAAVLLLILVTLHNGPLFVTRYSSGSRHSDPMVFETERSQPRRVKQVASIDENREVHRGADILEFRVR